MVETSMTAQLEESDSRGPFRDGGLALLIDRKGRRYLLHLREEGAFHTHMGYLEHRAIIGREPGEWFQTNSGHRFLALKPTLSDYILEMKRATQVIYPKDVGAILMLGDIFPGARVVEGGFGSGALTMALLRAVGPEGSVTSYEIRPGQAEKVDASDTAPYARRGGLQRSGGGHLRGDRRAGGGPNHAGPAGAVEGGFRRRGSAGAGRDFSQLPADYATGAQTDVGASGTRGVSVGGHGGVDASSVARVGEEHEAGSSDGGAHGVHHDGKEVHAEAGFVNPIIKEGERIRMDREATMEFLGQHVKTEVLMRHLLGVEAAMRGYARKYGEDEEEWGIAGLVHDFDWEICPTPEEHPMFGAGLLREAGFPEHIVRAVLDPRRPHGAEPRQPDGEDAVRSGRAIGVHPRGGAGASGEESGRPEAPQRSQEVQGQAVREGRDSGGHHQRRGGDGVGLERAHRVRD